MFSSITIMKLVLIMVFIRIYIIDGRVFCQDLHASPWMRIGFSCPLNCGNIATAVKKLKTSDYKIIFMNKLRNTNRSAYQSSTEMLQFNDIFNKRKSFNFIPSNSLKMFEDKKMLASLKIALNLALNESGECQPKNGGNNMSKCRRTYDHDEFIKKFTILLNKYTKSEYQFTEEMTSIILEKILGTNMDLRHGLFNVKRILTSLSKAIRFHRTHTQEGAVIKLKSRRCLSLSVAGCYCKTGLVENSGQCVHPSDCIQKHDNEYLARIILL